MVRMAMASPLAKTFMSFEGASASRWQLVSARSTDQHKQLKLERASHTATVVNGFIYVIAGRKGTTFYGDLLRFDTATHTWSVICPAIPNGFQPRANHTATLVGGRHIWVVAGSDNEKVIGDVHVFDWCTHTWTKPHIRGELGLLSRTAHSAELHPHDPRVILLFGGYDGAAFHNDLVSIRTDTLTVDRVVLSSGGLPPPMPRGYHSCTSAGNRCYVYGGRTEAGVVDANEMLAVYDAVDNQWQAPQVEGTCPQARSSHRAVALGNRLLIHGGAAAGDQNDRLADLHSLLICPHTGQLTWSRMDEPPPTIGSSTSHTRPQGRSAHTVSLVGLDSLYVMCGYMGAHPGPRRYSGDVFQLLLGIPSSREPPSAQPQPSPRRSPSHHLLPLQPQVPLHSPQQPPTHKGVTGRSSPRAGAAAAAVQSAAGGLSATTAATAAAAAAVAVARPSGGGSTSANPTHQASPMRQDASAAAGAASRPSNRRLEAVASDPVPTHHPSVQAHKPALSHLATPTHSRRGGGSGGSGGGDTDASGAGGEDDPIDLTAELPADATPLKAAVRAVAPAAEAGRSAQQVPRAGGGLVGGPGSEPAISAEDGWLGANRRSRLACGSMMQPRPKQQQQLAARAPATARAPAVVAVPAVTGLQGRPLEAQAHSEAADSRAAKRHASEAAVGRGRLPVQVPQTAAGHACAGVAPPAPEMPPSSPPPPRQQRQHSAALGSSLAHGGGPAAASALRWQAQAQAEVYGLAPGTTAGAATGAATAAVAATTATSNGPGGAYHRPPSPSHDGRATFTSERALLSQLLQDNQSLRRQLQEAQDAERQANQKAEAQQEQQRRTAEELSTQRRTCEMTQAALRTVNAELEEARTQLEHLQQDLAAAKQQTAAQQQQQQAAAAQQAADWERAMLQARTALMQQAAEEARKYQDQIKSLEALCCRHQAEADQYQRDLRSGVERHCEEVAALNERLSKREQDAAELANQLHEAAAQNQKLQQELGRLQDAKRRLEGDISEARAAQQRLQRQMDEEVGDLGRQRDSLQTQLTHAQTRTSALESELRRTKDDLAHRDAQHAALLQANADKATELAGVREHLRATQQKQEVTRSLLMTQIQTLQATVQTMANGS